MLEKIKSWLGFHQKEDSKKSCKKLTINDVDVLDNVWIKENDNISSGWIYSKEKDRLLVSYCDLSDYSKSLIFLVKDKTATELHKNNITIYLNDPRK